MGARVKIAGVQMEPRILETERNLARCLELTEIASREGARLIVFPEVALSGYIFTSLDEALPFAEPIPGPSTEAILSACRELNVYVIIGLLEEEGGKYYNAAAFLGPQGLVSKYRKLHLPHLGIDRFVNHGDLPLTVHDTEVGRIGIGICYDQRFPEHARVLALQGADVIVIITNWPEGAEVSAEYMVRTRANENNVFYVAVNRIGEERGVNFLGLSKIVHCNGDLLVEGGRCQEDILYAEIEPALARQKQRQFVQGELGSHMFNNRRPELYGVITQPLPDTPPIR